MLPLDNKHTEALQECEFFKEVYVDQVSRARDSVFNEMCEEMNISDYQDVSACNMAKKTITRDKLVSWLETVCCILDSFAAPLLNTGVDMLDEFQKLKEDKIKHQETIITLQDKLIEKKEVEISAIQSTVKSEMKSYSSAVSKSCTAALAPKKIQAAVKKVAEKNDRSRNVVIYGVPEKNSEELEKCVEDILAEIEEKPRVQHCCRIGLAKPEKCRPIKFTLSSQDHVNQVLRKTKLLRTKEGFSSVYVCPDRSVEERKAFKKLLDELKQKRISETDYVHTIKNNKTVSVRRDSIPGKTG